MNVGVVGASGLVGSSLCVALEKAGHQWVGFSRSPEGREGEWRSMAEGVAGLDAVVNVAGDPIDKRWTEQNKKRFHQSRVGVTEEIVRLMDSLPEGERPQVLLNSSAVGYYGDQDDTVLTEASPMGEGYLAELCEEWEAAAVKAESLGVRVILGRIGVVLGREALAWKKMKPLFQLGGGGRLGSGQQFWPVIHVDDVVGGIIHALESETIKGPMNLVGLTTVRNTEFTQTLASTLSRPAVLPVPEFALKLVLGEFASALLESYRVEPGVLLESGYRFQHSELRGIFESLK